MNSFDTLRVFAAVLLASVLLGPPLQWLLPGWATLVADVGSGGAWFVSILYHVIYGVLIGAGAALGDWLLRRRGREVPVVSGLVSGAVVIVLFDLGYFLLAPRVEQFASLAVVLALMGLVAQLLAGNRVKSRSTGEPGDPGAA